jgi:hypothetical protein
MMQRRYVLISLLFVMTVIAVYDACATQGGSIGTLVAMATRGSMLGLGVVLFLGASLLLQRWMTHSRPTAQVARAARLGRPGRFRVIGTDQETHLHTTEFVIADSAEHAATKVNLKGVDVEEVYPA